MKWANSASEDCLPTVVSIIFFIISSLFPFFRTTMFGIDFSPMYESWDERKLDLGVLYHFILLYPLAIFGFLLPFILVGLFLNIFPSLGLHLVKAILQQMRLYFSFLQLFTFQWQILLIYGIWYYYDRSSPKRGGYPSEWVQRFVFYAVPEFLHQSINALWRWTVHKWFADYFPVKLHKTVDLSASHVRSYYIVAISILWHLIRHFPELLDRMSSTRHHIHGSVCQFCHQRHG